MRKVKRIWHRSVTAVLMAVMMLTTLNPVSAFTVSADDGYVWDSSTRTLTVTGNINSWDGKEGGALYYKDSGPYYFISEEGVTKIVTEGLYLLQEVTVASTVTDMTMFMDTYNVTKITFKGSAPPAVSSGMWEADNSNLVIYVPYGSENAYTASLPSSAASKIQTDPATVPSEHTHTPGAVVQENTVPATCTEAGSYDSVFYCTECGEEISRETVMTDIDPDNHDFVDGVCTRCGTADPDYTAPVEEGTKYTVMPGLGSLAGGGINKLYIGTDTINDSNNDSIDWYLLTTSGGNSGAYKDTSDADVSSDDAAFIFAADTYGGGGYGDGDYSTSYVRTEKCIPYYQNGFFTDVEKTAFLQTTVSGVEPEGGTWVDTNGNGVNDYEAGTQQDCMAIDAPLAGDYLFAPSFSELINASYGFNADLNGSDPIRHGATKNSSAELYWTRNTALQNNQSGVALYFNIWNDTFNTTMASKYNANRTVRPAANLNVRSVLFTSPAAGGKVSGDAGEASLTAVGTTDATEWKLTLKDAGRAFSAVTTSASNDVLTIAYSGAASGDNEYVSAIVKDSEDSIVYYGKLKNITVSSEEAGNVTLDLSGIDIDGGSVYLFSEQANGDYVTDYASEPVEVETEAEDPAPTTYKLTTSAATVINGNGNYRPEIYIDGAEYTGPNPAEVEAGQLVEVHYRAVERSDDLEWQTFTADYTLDGEEHSDSIIGSERFYMPAADVTVTAIVQKLYEVRVNVPENGSIAIKADGNDVYLKDWSETQKVGYVKPDATVTVVATPDEGYETENITVTGAVLGSDGVTFTMPIGNTTVSASFTEAEVPVTYNLTYGRCEVTDGPGTYNPNIKINGTAPSTGPEGTVAVEPGSTITINYSAVSNSKAVVYTDFAAYYTLDGEEQVIDLSGAGRHGSSFKMPAADVVIVAKAQQLTYVNVDPMTNGSIILREGEETFDYSDMNIAFIWPGKVVEIVPVPDEGYELDTVTATPASSFDEEAMTYVVPRYSGTTNFKITVTFKEAEAVHVHDFGEDGFCTECGEYDPEASVYTVRNSAQLSEISRAVKAGDNFTGKNVILANDISLADVENFTPIGGNSSKKDLTITSQSELDEALAEHVMIYDDRGISYVQNSDKNLPYDENRTYYYLLGAPFAGTFNGAGYEITDLTINTDQGYAGLFGDVSGTVKNVTVKGTVASTTTADFVGGIAGKVSAGGTIDNCRSYANVSSNGYNTGGVVGFVGEMGKLVSDENPIATVKNCAFYGYVTSASQRLGGIAGRNAGLVESCANHGTVVTTYARKNGVAGVVGMNGVNNTATDAGIIRNCYTDGDVNTNGCFWSGGIVGFNNAKSTIDNCYSASKLVNVINPETGAVWGMTNPIAGQNEGKVNNCIWLNKTIDSTSESYIGSDPTGIYNSGGISSDIDGITEEQLKTSEAVEVLNKDGTAFKTNCGSYPVLLWEESSAHKFGTDYTVTESTYTKEDGVIKGHKTYTCTECGATKDEEFNNRFELNDVTVTLTDLEGNEETLATWVYVEPLGDGKGVYYDAATGEILSIFKDFTKDENQSGELPDGTPYDFSQYGAIPYSGMQGAFIPSRIRSGVTVKGILIEDLIDYAEELSGQNLRGETKLGLSASKDGHGDMFAYDEYYSMPRYFYPNFRDTVQSDGTADWSDPVVVPASLAVVGYNDSVSDPTELIEVADSMNSLRNFIGLADGATYGVSITDRDNPNYRTMGARSTTNITNIAFELSGHMHEFTEDGFCTDCGEYNPADEDGTYVVKTPEQLAEIGRAVNAGDAFSGDTVELGEDIDISGYTDWTAIGNAAAPFEGTFDGKDKAVTGLTVATADGGYRGLFGYSKGTVKDFAISGTIGTADAYITSGSDNIGGAVGYNDGTVSGVKGNVTVFINTNAIYAAGGIVGQNGDEATVTGCLNEADVTATKHSGGVVGRNYGTVTLCKNTGNVTGNGGGKDGIGGIVGCAGDKSGTYQNSITYCYNTGTTSNAGGRWQGGIAGFADKATTLTNCYSVGTVVPGYSWNWNAVIGHVDSAYSTVHDNYSLDTITNGDSTAATQPLTIGTKKTEAELKSEGFVAEINGEGEGFKANCGTYPVLIWEESTEHTPGDTTTENLVSPTCHTDGSVDIVTHCSVCEAETARTVSVIPAIPENHKAGAPVLENLVDPTCTEDGSVDVIISCTECGEVISTTTTVIEAAGHKLEKVEAKEATYEEDGNTEYWVCPVCGETFADEAGEEPQAIEDTVIKKLLAFTYTDPEGNEFTITGEMIAEYGTEATFTMNDKQITAVFAKLTDLIAAAGAEEGNCMYTASTATDEIVLDSDEELYVYNDNGGIRTAVDNGPGWKWWSGITNITASDHDFDSKLHVCTNKINDTKRTKAACGEKQEIAPESITLDKEELILGAGASEAVTAEVLPEEATDKEVVWTSSDEKIATVDENGNVTGVKQGKAVITATVKDTEISTAVNVRVLFDDVPYDHSFANAVYWAADNKISNGMSGSNDFGVSNEVTRGQVVTFLWKLAGSPAPVKNTQTFSDVPTSHSYYKAVQWASEQGITGGYKDGTFKPSGKCTRGQIATFIWRYEGQKAPQKNTKTFSDVPTNHGYYKAVQWCSEQGIVAGYKDGTFGVNKNCTRGQMTMFIWRAEGKPALVW